MSVCLLKFVREKLNKVEKCKAWEILSGICNLENERESWEEEWKVKAN